jgi:hypothetical protein
LLDASTATIDLQDHRFLTGTPHNGKKDGDQLQPQNLTNLKASSHDQVQVSHHQVERKNGQGNNFKRPNMLVIITHELKYLQGKSVLDQAATVNNTTNYIKRNTNPMKVG